MRRCIRALLLVALFTVLLCGSALAAEAKGMTNLQNENGYRLTPKDVNNDTTTPGVAANKPFYKDAVRVDLTVSGTKEEEYLVFLLAGPEPSSGPVPTESNIVYIDQQSGAGGNVIFGIYPKDLVAGQTYNAYVSSTNSALTKVGSFVYASASDYKDYMLGDVDNDGKILAPDSLSALEISVGKTGFTDFQKLAAEVDGVEPVTANDALLILQKSVGKPVF